MKIPLCPDIVGVALLAKIVAIVETALVSVICQFGPRGSPVDSPTPDIAKAGAGAAATGFAFTARIIVKIFIGGGVVTAVAML